MKYDIVFIGDGFTASEQGDFNRSVDDTIDRLWNFPPDSTFARAFM